MNLDSSRRRAARSSLRDQLRETTRVQILQAAEELIAARGLERASLAMIARRAGVAVGTLYNYFTDRDAMIRALFDWRRATLRPQVLAAAAESERLAFEPRLRAFVRLLLRAFEAHRRFIKVALETEHHKLSPSKIPDILRGSLEDIVAAGVVEQVVHPAHANLLALLVQGAIKAVVLRRTADGGDYVEDADGIVAIVLDGARRRE